MKIKRFFASSMREAMRRVREEQGPEAVILASHTREDGIEVVAAVDYDEALMRQAVAQRTAEAPAPRPAAPAPATKPAATHKPAPPPAATVAQTVQWPMDPQIRRLEDELGALRQLLETTLAATETRLTEAHPSRARVLRLMESLGFSPRIAQRMAASLPVDADEARIRCLPVGWLARHLQVRPPALLQSGGRVALVGPTGVGKTTTLAKLAQRAVRRFGARQVALISLDTFRIGAEEQLSAYARLLGVPLFVVTQPEQLGSRLLELADCRCVLIDTPGMSPGDERLMGALEVLGTPGNGIESWLVLSAGQQVEDQAAAVHRFRGARPQALALTKLDECSRLGGALSVALEQNLPLSVIGDGQRVPEDLHVARAADLVLRALRNARAAPAAAAAQTASIPSERQVAHG